jgi:hypothetical protein
VVITTSGFPEVESAVVDSRVGGVVDLDGEGGVDVGVNAGDGVGCALGGGECGREEDGEEMHIAC